MGFSMARTTTDDLPGLETQALERMLEGLCLDAEAELLRIVDPLASVSEAYSSYSEHKAALGDK